MATWPAHEAARLLVLEDPLRTVAVPALPIELFVGSGQADSSAAVQDVDNTPAVVVELWQAFEVEQSSGGFHWFEDFHVIPRELDFGNLLADQSVPLEVFSAFRQETREWTSFTNNAGNGVTLVGAPGLPVQVEPFSGFAMTVEVSTVGPAFVEGSLDFVFDSGDASVPVLIQRIVFWFPRPEIPYAEVLGFLTDVHRSKDGSEQRASLRKNPRQGLEYEFRVEEGEEKQVLENLLFDWQARIFGVSIWREETELTVAATSGDVLLTVAETAWRDFRIGGLAAVFTSRDVFDVVGITSVGATAIGLDSPLVNSYPVGTSVSPLSTSRATPRIAGGRYPVGLSVLQIVFEATDNDVDLADVSAFPSYNGKVLLELDNVMRGQVKEETFEIDITDIDNLTGIPTIDSAWDHHKRSYPMVMRAQGMQAIWEMRGLIHALRGRQVSFYTSRSSDDLVVVANLLNASNTMDVENWQYTQFVRSRQHKNVIRLTFNDGNPPLVRTITGAVNIDAATDQLEVDVNWPRTILPSEIERIEYVEKLRLDTDDVRIEYDVTAVRAYMVAPVRTVFE